MHEESEDDQIVRLKEVNRLYEREIRLLTSAEWLDKHYYPIWLVLLVVWLTTDVNWFVWLYLGVCITVGLAPYGLRWFADVTHARAESVKNRETVSL